MDKISAVVENTNNNQLRKKSKIEEYKKTKKTQSFLNQYTNILPPIVAGLISVIVNYGGTFILILVKTAHSG